MHMHRYISALKPSVCCYGLSLSSFAIIPDTSTAVCICTCTSAAAVFKLCLQRVKCFTLSRQVGVDPKNAAVNDWGGQFKCGPATILLFCDVLVCKISNSACSIAVLVLGEGAIWCRVFFVSFFLMHMDTYTMNITNPSLPTDRESALGLR